MNCIVFKNVSLEILIFLRDYSLNFYKAFPKYEGIIYLGLLSHFPESKTKFISIFHCELCMIQIKGMKNYTGPFFVGRSYFFYEKWSIIAVVIFY